jgi:hypothetical protein
LERDKEGKLIKFRIKYHISKLFEEIERNMEFIPSDMVATTNRKWGIHVRGLFEEIGIEDGLIELFRDHFGDSGISDDDSESDISYTMPCVFKTREGVKRKELMELCREYGLYLCPRS